MDLCRRLRPPAPCFLLAFLLLVVPNILQAQAQATTGVVRGTVSDSAGTPFGGCCSSPCGNRETNATRTLNTTRAECTWATLLRVGSYDVGARALGFRESGGTA